MADRIELILQIQRTLLNAHREQCLFHTALETLSIALSAEQAFFFTLPARTDQPFAVWADPASPGQRQPEALAALLADPEPLARLTAGEAVALGALTAVPVRDLAERPVAALGTVGSGADADVLRCVATSFFMALNNTEYFSRLESLEKQDLLTGLPNRSAFQEALERYERGGEDSLGCVYLDADGLHEVNNHYGHLFGDRMLQATAAAIQREFGGRNAYRIGGDEFVIFLHSGDEDQARRSIQRIQAELDQDGYHVSAGTAFRKNVPLVSAMIAHAERQMYANKEAYYATGRRDGHIRKMNLALEKTLREKQDLDLFRAVLAHKYMGVYIVNLGTDAMRAIYIPPFFKSALTTARGKFSRAIQMYAQECMQPAYIARFLSFLNYDATEAELLQGGTPGMRYLKKDGTPVDLHIYLSPNHSPQRRECVWAFEVVAPAG